MSLTDREIQNLKDLIPRVAELENGLAAADTYAKTLVVAKELASIHGSRLIGHHKYLGHAHSVETMLAHNTLHWLLDGGVITDAGGLNITWTAGTVFDATNNMGEIFNARTSNQALTDDAVNYIYKASGNKTLQVGVVHPDWGAGEIEIAHAHCANGDIWGLHQEEHPGHALTDTLHALGEVIPSAVVSGGLIISEDTDVTNAFDVIQSAGTFYKQMHEEIPVVQIVSRTTNMYRWYRDGAGTDYTNDTNASIDVTQYDNGGTLTAIPSNKWVRSVFFTDGSKIHWVYPTAVHTNVFSAISAADPALPTGLGHFPKTTAVIYQEGATEFPAAGSDLWIDVRPVLGAGGTGASITDHGELGGLADKDHSAYLENTGDQMDGQLIIDETNAEAFLVRKDTDGGDVFTVDTTNGIVDVDNAIFYVNARVTTETDGTRIANRMYGVQADINNDIDINLIASQFYHIKADIANTKTNSGDQIALDARANINDANFLGTLAKQYGILVQFGIANGTGTVTTAYGLYIDPRHNNGTITNSYGIYIDAPTAGGTVSNEWAMYIADNALSYFVGSISAQNVTDRTPFYEGDALEEIKNIEGKDGKIDHDTLPEFVQVKRKVRKALKKLEIVDGDDITEIDKGELVHDTSKLEIDKDYEEVEVTERDLGSMISVLTTAVQQLTDRIEKIEKAPQV